MCEYIKAKSLKFLSLDGLYKALTGKREILIILNLVIIILLEIIQLNQQIIYKDLKLNNLSLIKWKIK